MAAMIDEIQLALTHKFSDISLSSLETSESWTHQFQSTGVEQKGWIYCVSSLPGLRRLVITKSLQLALSTAGVTKKWIITGLQN